MTTAHTQHFYTDNSDGSDRDAPITEPFSVMEWAFGIACLALATLVIGAILGYIWALR